MVLLLTAVAPSAAEPARTLTPVHRKNFDALHGHPRMSPLQGQLAELERPSSGSHGGIRDREDFKAISLQNRLAFCRYE